MYNICMFYIVAHVFISHRIQLFQLIQMSQPNLEKIYFRGINRKFEMSLGRRHLVTLNMSNIVVIDKVTLNIYFPNRIKSRKVEISKFISFIKLSSTDDFLFVCNFSLFEMGTKYNVSVFLPIIVPSSIDRKP